MVFALLLDILVAVLLAVTIVYSVILNRRLGVLRQDKAELERVAATFGEATRRAEDSIGRLRDMADTLQEQIKKAQALRDDLAFLMDRGGATADRLEDAVRSARKESAPAGGVTGGTRPAVSLATAAAAAAAAAPQPAAAPEPPRAKIPIPKVDTGLKAPPETRPATRSPLQGIPEPRSEAERELLKALESAR
ncbi:MAG: DUF6468 domain-containing protein [Magnetospirillum sp. WYHS-4]